MSMSGKMSVGILTMVRIPRMMISIDITTKGYGRLSAIRTSHIMTCSSYLESRSETAHFEREYCFGDATFRGLRNDSGFEECGDRDRREPRHRSSGTLGPTLMGLMR